MFQFDCPCCPQNGRIISETENGLNEAIRDHIREHERIAGRKAVDSAIRTCGGHDCRMGTVKVWNTKTIAYEEKLTAYDASFLASMGISYVDPAETEISNN